MEKRFVLFITLTMLIVVGYNALLATFGPPRKPAPKKDVAKQDAGPDAPKALTDDGLEAAADKQPAKDEAEKLAAEKIPAETAPGAKGVAGAAGEKPAVAEESANRSAVAHRVVTLGSYLAGGTSPLLATFNSRGATLERVELVERESDGGLRYRDLDNTAGYVGNLSLVPEIPTGCRVQVVPAGTPAATAEPADLAAGVGLKPGDLILALAGRKIASQLDVDAVLADRKPKDVVELEVERNVGGQPQKLSYRATLSVRPLELLRPEPLERGELRAHPPSLQMTISDARREQGQGRFLEALLAVDWEVVELQGDAPGIEFRYRVDADRATELGLGGPVEIAKRFRLGVPQAAGEGTGAIVHARPYHVQLEVEFRNLASTPQKIVYRLDGTNGLPTEGWWYLAKIHTEMFASAGARDIVVDTDQGGHRLIGSSAILTQARKEEKAPELALFGEGESTAARSVSYIGVDTQYFAAALLPQPNQPGERMSFGRAEALALGDVMKKPKGWERTANVSFRLFSEPISLDPDSSYRQAFTVFLGPKEPKLLAEYRMSDLIYYGWFGSVSRMLAGILHFFHDVLIGNYAIAIIMLTVLVRGCMFPLSRKAAKNAAMMQELAPEMRKIAEKYKNNMEARGKAQQDLFKKHHYNPFSGCWMMFLQLPVFIGLYRCLAVDIRLRQAPLFNGIEWASNLAGPDKLFHWKSNFFSFLTDESGWLGPYFNLLPIFTIALFLVHQRLFTPPATDEQTALQLKMMKYMTIFMGVLFYKVPAGLCIYFIASSLWGIAERKLLPKPVPATSAAPPPPPLTKPPKSSSNDPFAFIRNRLAPKPDGNGTSSRRKSGKRPKR